MILNILKFQKHRKKGLIVKMLLVTYIFLLILEKSNMYLKAIQKQMCVVCRRPSYYDLTNKITIVIIIPIIF